MLLSAHSLWARLNALAMGVAIVAGGSLFAFGQTCGMCVAVAAETVEQAETPSCHAPVEVAVPTCHASKASTAPGLSVITSCQCGDHNEAVIGFKAASVPARTTVEPVALVQQSYFPARLSVRGAGAAHAAIFAGQPPGQSSRPIYLRDSVIRI